MFWQVLLSTKPATGATCGVDRERGREAARSVRPADVDRICRNKMSPCSLSSLPKFQEGLWHPRSWGERAPPWFSISVSGLPANEGFLRTLIGCLYLCLAAREAKGRRHGAAEAITSGVCFSPAPLPQALPLPVCRSCPGRGLGKHPWADGSGLSPHLKCMSVPSRALLSKVWQWRKQTPLYNILGCASKMQKQLIRSLPETPHNVAAADDTELGFGGSLEACERARNVVMGFNYLFV